MKKCVIACLLLATALQLSAKDLYFVLVKKSGVEISARFEKYDRKKLNFEVKLDRKKKKINLIEVRSIYFDTQQTPHLKKKSVVDAILLQNDRVLEGVFQGMDKKKVRLMLLRKDFKEVEISGKLIKRIDFSTKMLDVHRREFGKGFNLFSKDIEVNMASAFAADLEQQTSIVSDTLVTNYVDRLGKKIAKSSKRQTCLISFVLSTHMLSMRSLSVVVGFMSIVA